MIELFEVYKFAFLLSPLAAAVLCIFGTHMVSRNEGLQLMALSQAALVGNILGRLIDSGSDLLGLVLSLCFFVAAKFILARSGTFKEQVYIVIYLVFIALSYFLVTWFPGLDSHYAVGFFGDIVSISAPMSVALSLVFMVLLLASVYFHRSLVRSTLSRSVLRSKNVSLVEECLFVTGILLSLYGLGFLFTLSFLIFPLIVVGPVFNSLKQGLLVTTVVSASAAVVGLSLSIFSSQVATVPAQVLALVFMSLLTRVFFRTFVRSEWIK